MSKPKIKELPFKSDSESAVGYTEWTPSNTPDLEAYRGMADKPESVAPALAAQYNRAVQTNNNRLRSSYAQNLPADARLAMQERAQRDLNADYGAQINQSAYDAYDRNLQRRANLAEMTLGRPLQTSSRTKQSGTNSQLMQGGGLLNSLLQGAATVGAAFA